MVEWGREQKGRENNSETHECSMGLSCEVLDVFSPFLNCHSSSAHCREQGASQINAKDRKKADWADLAQPAAREVTSGTSC